METKRWKRKRWKRNDGNEQRWKRATMESKRQLDEIVCLQRVQNCPGQFLIKFPWTSYTHQ